MSDYEKKYQLMYQNRKSLDELTEILLTAKCQENEWLRVGGYDFEDGFLDEEEYHYVFKGYDDMEALLLFFQHGNWAIRQGVVYGDLAFIQQVNGGDEWWTLKKFNDEWVDFESISFNSIIRNDGREKFLNLMESLIKASREQCEGLTYMD